MQENSTFKINLISYLAAAYCASGVAGNNEISKFFCTIIYHQQDSDNMDVMEVIFINIAKHADTVISHNNFMIWLQSKTHCTKTARYVCLIFLQRMQENITFKMNLVSHLAAAYFASGVAGNIEISKHTCTIIYHQQDPDNMDVLEVIFPQNGLLFFKNTSPHNRRQYFLLNEPSQLFGRSNMCVWQSYKHQHCETLWHSNISQ